MTDPQLIDPENGDYSLAETSLASDYGCQTFSAGKIYPVSYQASRELTPDSRTTLGGIISESTLLTSLDIQVTDNVHIEDGVTLAFTPGATISFNEFYSINVQGTILAQGTADERITFTASDPYLFTYDNDLAGCWNGFKFIDTNDANPTSRFSYTIMEYAKAVDESSPGFTDSGALLQVYNFANLRVENSIFRNNYANYGAIFALNKDSNISFINNQVTDNKVALGGSMALISYSNPRIVNNTIVNNEVLNQDDFHSTGVIESYISKPIIYNNIIYQNTDYFFEEEQLFSAKAYHTQFNALDFTFGNNNIFLADGDLTVNEAGIYLFNSSEIIASASPELPFSCQLPSSDIVGNPRLHNSSLDMGAVQIQAVSNDNETQVITPQMSLYPNPFNPEITIKFPISKTSYRSLSIYNLKGQVVKSFKNIEIGTNKIIWNGKNNFGENASSGIYFFKYQSDSHTEIRKALLLK